MAKTITVIDSSGGKREVSDTPENVQLAKNNGFQVERGLFGEVANWAAGSYEDSIEGRIVKKGLQAVGIAPADAAPIDHTGKITVVDSTGGRKEVTDSAENRQLATDNGFKIESLTQTKAADILAQPEYQGARGAGHAFGAKRASEFTFGVSEMARKYSMSDEQKLAYDTNNANNPEAATVGSGLGMIGNIAASSGAGSLGGAAAQAEKLASKALGKIGLEATGSLTSRALLNAGKQAAAGAVYAAPHAAGQAVFEDPVKAGESMGMGIGIGAVLGGAGPLLGAFGRTIVPLSAEKAANQLSEHGLDPATRTMKALGMERATYNKIEGEQTGNVKKIGNILYEAGVNEPGLKQAEMVARANALRESSGAKIGEIQKTLDEHIAAKLEEAQQARKFVPSINPDAGLEKVAGKGEKVFANRIGAEPGIDLADHINPYPPVIGKFGDTAEHLDGKVSLFQSAAPLESEAAPLFRKQLSLTEQALGNAKTDKANRALSIVHDPMAAVDAAEQSFNPRTVIEHIQNEMLPKYEGPLYATQKRHLIKSIEQIAGDVTGQPFKYTSPEELNSFLQDLKPTTLGVGQEIKSRMKNGVDLARGTAPTDKSKLSLEVYNLVKNELTDATGRVAETAGTPELKAAYDLARSQYWASSVATKDLIPKLYAKEVGNRFFSPSDHSTGGIAAIGAAMHYGPKGLLLAAPAYAAKRIAESNPFQSTVTAGIDKVSQAFRAMTAEVVASKIAQLDEALTSKAVGAAVRVATSNDPSPISTLVGGTETDPRKAFADFQTKIAPYAADNAKLQAHLSSTAQHITDAGDPDAAIHYLDHQMKAFAYLQSQMPKAPMNPALFYNPEYKPSAIELKNFSDACAAAQDPFFIVRKIENGTLTDKQISHVKALYPELSNLIVERIKTMGYEHQLSDNKTNLPYNVRSRMSRLTGALGDPGMDPAKSKAMQSIYAKKKADKPENPKGDYTNNLATETQKLQM